MGLKYKYRSREEIPAEYQGFYVEREGAWTPYQESVVLSALR